MSSSATMSDWSELISNDRMHNIALHLRILRAVVPLSSRTPFSLLSAISPLDAITVRCLYCQLINFFTSTSFSRSTLLLLPSFSLSKRHSLFDPAEPTEKPAAAPVSTDAHSALPEPRSLSVTRFPTNPPFQAHLGNINENVTEDELMELFKEYNVFVCYRYDFFSLFLFCFVLQFYKSSISLSAIFLTELSSFPLQSYFFHTSCQFNNSIFIFSFIYSFNFFHIQFPPIHHITSHTTRAQPLKVRIGMKDGKRMNYAFVDVSDAATLKKLIADGPKELNSETIPVALGIKLSSSSFCLFVSLFKPFFCFVCLHLLNAYLNLHMLSFIVTIIIFQ